MDRDNPNLELVYEPVKESPSNKNHHEDKIMFGSSNRPTKDVFPIAQSRGISGAEATKQGKEAGIAPESSAKDKRRSESEKLSSTNDQKQNITPKLYPEVPTEGLDTVDCAEKFELSSGICITCQKYSSCILQLETGHKS